MNGAPRFGADGGVLRGRRELDWWGHSVLGGEETEGQVLGFADADAGGGLD